MLMVGVPGQMSCMVQPIKPFVYFCDLSCFFFDEYVIGTMNFINLMFKMVLLFYLFILILYE